MTTVHRLALPVPVATITMIGVHTKVWAMFERLTRRDFLQAGAGGALGVSILGRPTSLPTVNDDRSAILIVNVGGPSQLDTWDPKPAAASEVRGPFRAIRTRVPGIELSELFPRMARLTDRFSLVRSCHHTAAAVHDQGHQLVQTGRLHQRTPHPGSVLSYLRGGRGDAPACVLLPEPIGRTGGDGLHGQDAGTLSTSHNPWLADARTSNAACDLATEPRHVCERYGEHRLGQAFLRARRLIESGVRVVTINTFSTVFDAVSWDTHGRAPFSTLADLRDTVAPRYDQAYSALLEDLLQRGRLDTTLVASLAEFGRTPRLNAVGGRDHWTGCWTVTLAGGGVQGGRVVGRSDAIGGSPVDRPVAPAELVATIYRSLGVPRSTRLPGLDGRPVPLVDHATPALDELF